MPTRQTGQRRGSASAALGFFHTVADEVHVNAILRRIEESGYFTDSVVSGRVTVARIDLVLVFVGAASSNRVLGVAALAQKVRIGTTGKQGVKLSDVVELSLPITAILERLDQPMANRLFGHLLVGSTRPTPEDWNRIWQIIKELRPDLLERLLLLESRRRGRTFAFESVEEEVFFCQRDALGVALDLTEIPRDHVFDEIGVAFDRGDPLLTSLCGNPTERVFLSHDVRVVSGFESIGAMSDHKCSFRRGDTTLDVYNVDMREGERALGVDLVYFNHRYASFVFVQYKMMEPSPNDRWRFMRDAQCVAEEIRMRRALQAFGAVQVPQSEDNYRLSVNPFFFKLCKRDRTLLLETAALTQGLYLHLDYWDALQSNPEVSSRGVGFHNASRWMCKTEFVQFVQRGWIGSRGISQQMLVQYIDQCRASRRNVVVAVSGRVSAPALGAR